MAKRMLIDAAQPDEQRVVVLEDKTLLEADFFSAAKTQIKGNVYLARVTRVEPSLQAAFVDFGNDKHGFLPFSEIHPDYFQIPVADREALLEEVQTALASRQSEPEDESSDETAQEEEAKAEETKEDSVEEEAESKGVKSDSTKPKAKSPRKRASRAKKKVAGEEEAPLEETPTEEAPASEGAPAAQDAGDTPGEEKPKPRSRSRKKPTPKAEETVVEASEEATTPQGVEGDEPEAPQEPVKKPRGRPRKKPVAAAVEDEVVYADEDASAEDDGPETDAVPDEAGGTKESSGRSRSRGRRRGSKPAKGDNGPRPRRRRDEDTDDLSDADFEARTMTRAILGKKYKIQEVIKRNQVILVQAAKEERGDKGAALTTYLSLPGRYCVLMPNTHRGGGISRRIASAADRKRLKSVLDELDMAPSMSLIVRTAGAERTKQEIKRDFAYLTRTWDEIRETTLGSFAPALVYEEANLIKRAIRDIYETDTQEVLVAGEAAHKAAKAFMKTLTPSHAAKVKLYKEETPLFQAHEVEGMLESLNRPQVTLPSGGYLVLNQTEALVAIDVNSGKATRERNIEETALKTNLEAAREAARQLRLRDLAGLVVIDFIDMEENKNVAAVERALREALKPDRARIQVGRISQFGLMELSRQRLRPSVSEATMGICPTCAGSGYVKSNETNGRAIVRQIEEALMGGEVEKVTIFAGTDLALSIANDQRAQLARLEETYGTSIEIAVDTAMGPALYRGVITRNGRHEAFGNDTNQPTPNKGRGRGRGRDRQGGRDGSRENGRENAREGGRDGGREQNRNARDRGRAQDAPSDEATEAQTPGAETDSEEGTKRKRRGKRGGRGRGRRNEDAQNGSEAGTSAETTAPEVVNEEDGPQITEIAASEEAAAPKPKRTRRKKGEPEAADTPKQETPEGNAPDAETPKAKPKSRKPAAKKADKPAEAPAPEESTPEPSPEPTPAPLADTEPSDKPKKRGWWNRVTGQ